MPLYRSATRALILLLAGAVAFVGADVAGTSQAQAATGVRATSLSTSVSGAKVTATTRVVSTTKRTAARVGVCVRNAWNGNVDFPLASSVRLSKSGTVVKKSRTYSPGSYQYWTCVKVGSKWIDASARKRFTVKSPVSTVILPAPIASGERMPGDDQPGWKQVFTQDFSTPILEGEFPGPYTGSVMSYHNFADTSSKGWYDQTILSVHDGALDMHVQTRNGKALGAAPVPLVDGKWGGQVYGRFSVRMKSDAVPGFGTGFLLWSDANNWADGEIDFPESPLDGRVNAYNHCVGNPTVNCLAVSTSTTYADWHTYTIDWTPGRIVYYIDGQVVGSTTHSVPTKPMHWVLQVGTTGVTPDPSVSGHLLIDWMTIYRYVP